VAYIWLGCVMGTIIIKAVQGYFTHGNLVIVLLHTIMHTLAVSKSVACASTVRWFTIDWTSEVLDSFHFQILEQLDDHKVTGYYKLKQLAPNCDGQLNGVLVYIHGQTCTDKILMMVVSQEKT
ncbi:hypothetical protein MKW92_023090, partial [Papaver armeniacum]